MSNSKEIRQLDRVQILTTRNVRYLSDLPGQVADPHGFWSVVGFVSKEALIAKGSALIRIPMKDIRKVGEYDKDTVLNNIKNFIKRQRSGQKETPQAPDTD